MTHLNALATEIHEQNVAAGWWSDWPVKMDRFETAMCLVVTELAEAAEGARKNLPDDHLPEYPMFQVELADTAIRLLDLAGAYDTVVTGKRFDNTVSDFRDDLLDAENQLVAIWRVIQMCVHATGYSGKIRSGLAAVVALADLEGFDLWVVIDAKRKYNTERADHKAAARAGEHGKKF